MKRLVQMVVLLSAVTTGAAQAGDIAEDSYIGGSYFHQVAKGDIAGVPVPGDARKLDTFDIRYGFFLLPILAVEGHIGTSFNSYGSGLTPSNLQNEYYGAAYGRLNWPFYSRNMNIYAMGGVATSNYSGYNSDANVSMSETITGLSGAVGVQFFSGGTTSVALEWYRFMQSTEFHSGGYMITLMHGFSLWDFLLGD